jgi:hypothetical protein
MHLISSLKRSVVWSTVAAITAGVLGVLTPSDPALAAVNKLAIIQYSGTFLTVSWNGALITPTLLGVNHWQFTVPDEIFLGENLENASYPGGVAYPVPGAGNLGPWDNVDTTVTPPVYFVNLVDVQCNDSTTSPYNAIGTEGVAITAGEDSSGVPTSLIFDVFRVHLYAYPLSVIFDNHLVVEHFSKFMWSETNSPMSGPVGTTPPMFGIEVSTNVFFSQPMPFALPVRGINGMYLARDSAMLPDLFYRLSTAVTNIFIPAAATTAATAISSGGATLNGTTTPYGFNTAYWFEYGADTNYGMSTITNFSLATSTNLADLSCEISNLAPSTVYHFQVVVTDDDGTQLGGDQSFTTPSAVPPPTVVSLAASSVATTAATLNGSGNGNGLPIGGWFQYGTDTNYGSSTYDDQFFTSSDYSTAQDYSTPITGLNSSTTYHYRAIASSMAGEGFGADTTFTTAWAPVPPTLISPGTNTPAGPVLSGLTPTFEWSAASQAASSDLVVSQSPYGSGNVVFTAGVGVTSSYQIPSGYLQPGTAYAWYMVSFNSLGDESSQSSPLYFTTPAGIGTTERIFSTTVSGLTSK